MALKTIRSATLPLSNVGDTTLSVEEALVQSAPIMLSCYGHPECSSLTDARQHYMVMVAKSLTQYWRCIKLQSLVCPLNEAVMENVVMAHMHVLSNMAMGQSTMMDQRRQIYISEVAKEILPCSTCRHSDYFKSNAGRCASSCAIILSVL